MVLERRLSLGVKVFISERWSWSHNFWLFFKKRFIFNKSKITKVRATWKLTYLGAKVFLFCKVVALRATTLGCLKKNFILDESNHDEGSSRLEEGGNRTPQFSGIKVFFLYDEGRFGLAYEAFTFGTGPECKVSRHWFSSIRYELGQSVVRA